MGVKEQMVYSLHAALLREEMEVCVIADMEKMEKMRKRRKIILKTRENVFERVWRNLVCSSMENLRDSLHAI